jgi:hypothetical protein
LRSAPTRTKKEIPIPETWFPGDRKLKTGDSNIGLAKYSTYYSEDRSSTR